MNYNNNAMTLTADSGSTKCDWILSNEETGIVFKTRTKGLNPKLLNKNPSIKIVAKPVNFDNCLENTFAKKNC